MRYMLHRRVDDRKKREKKRIGNKEKERDKTDDRLGELGMWIENKW